MGGSVCSTSLLLKQTCPSVSLSTAVPHRHGPLVNTWPYPAGSCMLFVSSFYSNRHVKNKSTPRSRALHTRAALNGGFTPAYNSRSFQGCAHPVLLRYRPLRVVAGQFQSSPYCGGFIPPLWLSPIFLPPPVLHPWL